MEEAIPSHDDIYFRQCTFYMKVWAIECIKPSDF